jgi:hypothetical protein
VREAAVKRDINHMNDLLDEIRYYWRQHPDMRLGQLIVNAVGDDPFYVSDEDLVQRLKAFSGR